MSDAGELVQRFFDTLSTGDFEKIGEFFDDDSQWGNGSTAARAPAKGREGIIEGLLKPVRLGLFQEGDPKVIVKRLVVEGDWVAAETNGVGTMKNGAPYDNNYAWMIQVAGDKLRSLTEYMDTAYAQRVTQAVRDAEGQG